MSCPTRENGCVFPECIVKLPCKRKVVPKDREVGYCAWMVTEKRANAIEQKRVGGKVTNE